MNLYVINYETDKAVYKLYLLAEGREDAMGYIKWRQGEEPGFKVNSFEQREDVHAITPKLLDKLRPVDREVVTEKLLVCPWCESTEYGSPHALKMHIVKTHADSKDNKPATKDKKK